MNGRGNSIARAQAIYEMRLNPQRTREMREHLDTAAADSSALAATSVLCDYLNRWNDAGPDEVAKAEAAVHHALTLKPDHHLGHYAKGFLHRTRGEHEAALVAFTDTVKHNPNFARAHAPGSPLPVTTRRGTAWSHPTDNFGKFLRSGAIGTDFRQESG